MACLEGIAMPRGLLITRWSLHAIASHRALACSIFAMPWTLLGWTSNWTHQACSSFMLRFINMLKNIARTTLTRYKMNDSLSEARESFLLNIKKNIFLCDAGIIPADPGHSGWPRPMHACMLINYLQSFCLAMLRNIETLYPQLRGTAGTRTAASVVI